MIGYLGRIATLLLVVGIGGVGIAGTAAAEGPGGPRLIVIERGRPAVSIPVGSKAEADARLLTGQVRAKPTDIPEPEDDPNDIRAERLPARVKLAGYGSDCAAAEGGDALAAYRMGRRYLFGMGVKRNRNVGVAWMRQAAKLGSTQARRVVSLVPRRWGQYRPSCSGHGGTPRRFSAPPAEIVKLVNEIAPKYDLDPKLVLAVIQVESGFNSNAVSPKSAAGLMQLIPDTARRFGVKDVFDATQNIHGGAKYLRWLLAYFRGNVDYALAGYNAGEGAVDRYQGIPPYRETQLYVRWVRQIYKVETHAYDSKVASPSPRIPKQTADAGAEG